MGCSQGHVRENVLSADDAFQSPCAGINHGQAPEVHVAEDVQDLLQAVGALCNEGCLDHIRPNVDHAVEVFVADFRHIFVLPVRRIVVLVELPPVQDVLGNRNLKLILKHGELTKNFLALFHFLDDSGVADSVVVVHCGSLAHLVDKILLFSPLGFFKGLLVVSVE